MVDFKALFCRSCGKICHCELRAGNHRCSCKRAEQFIEDVLNQELRRCARPINGVQELYSGGHMQEHQTTGGKKKDKPEYPDSYKLEDGGSLIAMATAFRSKVGQYEQDVYEVVIRGQEERLYSLWWPFRLPAIPMMTPFYLKRNSKSSYRLLVAETDEDAARLWKQGEVDESKAGSEVGGQQPGGIPSKVADKLRKLKS